MKNLFGFLTVLLLCFVSTHAEEKSGELEGLLVSKNKSGKWIEFIADGSDKAVKYIPEWVGGNPKDGGGLKKETIEAISKIPAPNRVLLKWKDEEHLRVVEIKILEPEKKEGSSEGVVTVVNENWFEIKIGKGDKTRVERFTPKWKGGNPKDGGGLEKEMIQEIAKLKVGDTVSVKWVYDERKRVTKISKAIKD